MKLISIHLLFFVLISNFLYAQNKRIYEIQFYEKAPKIDGILDDDVWKNKSIAEDFTQTVPSPDKPSLYKSQVKMVYTTNSIFICAELFQPKSMHLKQLTARDELDRANADYFSVYLDTYNDHQNGFVFKVSSAGVQQDERLSNGYEHGDISWDAVWKSKVSIHDDKWIIEMEIPYSAIRFSKANIQEWGVNFYRSIRKLNESSYWNPINVRQQGFLIQCGKLSGLQHLKPPIRLFLYPYISTGYFERPENDSYQSGILKSGGIDIKYGLNESFTLDMTLIPDFSQVVSDNLIRNLSPFEQQLSENRPFFTEGTELFNKANLFYSRRVGARPSKYFSIQEKYGDTANYKIEKNPNVTSLLNAMKFSGRNKNNVGIGIFNAVGAPIKAKIFDKNSKREIVEETEPISNYNVIVIDKPFKGQSFFNFTNTNVLKNGFDRDANVSSVQVVKYDKNENYYVSLTGRLSIQNQEKFKTGTSWNATLSKVTGKIHYSAIAEMFTPKYDHSDMGILFDFNQFTQSYSITYTENKPQNMHLQMYRLAFSNQFKENLIPFVFKTYQVNASYFWLLKSFWDFTFEIESKPKTPIDFYQLRYFDKRLKNAPYLFFSLNGSSDSRKKIYWNYYVGYGISNRNKSGYFYAEQGLRYLIKSKLELSVNGNMTRDDSNIGFAFFDDIINQPIVGRRFIREYSGLFSVKYNFAPNVNLTARFRHYNNFITYRSLHKVDDFGNWFQNDYPFKTGLDENFNLQNIDVFFNWMFKPGSRLVVSYKQWLNDSYILNSNTSNQYYQNVYEVIKKPHAFELAVRLIYFLDYNEWANKYKKNNLNK